MLRLIGSVVAGYVIMFLVVFVALTAAYLGMGADRAFRAGVYDVTGLWLAVSLVVSIVAALAGGWTARRVARDVRGPWVLAGVVLVLGLAMAAPALFGDAPAVAVRTGATGNLEAMQQAQTPLWVLLLNPFIGAVGALVGGRALGAAATESRPFSAPAA
jgi:hypothetical protein